MLSKIRFSSMLLLMCVSTFLTAQPWAARHALNGAQYQATFSDMASKGFYPTVISGYVLNNQAAYAAIWEKKSIPASEFRHGLSAAQYQAVFNTFTQQGFRPAFINGFSVNGQDYYNAIFEKTGGPEYIARHGISAADYQKIFDESGPKGFRPKIISAFTVNGQARFAGVWIKDNSVNWVARHNLNPQQYQTEFNKWTQQGYKVACISGYTVNGQELFAAVWEKQNGPMWAAKHGIQGKFYQYEFDNFFYQGYRPRFINAYNVGNQDKFAGVWDNSNISGADMQKIDQAIQGYMSTNNVPGISIAFCKGGFCQKLWPSSESDGRTRQPQPPFPHRQCIQTPDCFGDYETGRAGQSQAHG
jgi:Bacterial tandem repeat domain 1